MNEKLGPRFQRPIFSDHIQSTTPSLNGDSLPVTKCTGLVRRLHTATTASEAGMFSVQFLWASLLLLRLPPRRSFVLNSSSDPNTSTHKNVFVGVNLNIETTLKNVWLRTTGVFSFMLLSSRGGRPFVTRSVEMETRTNWAEGKEPNLPRVFGIDSTKTK